MEAGQLHVVGGTRSARTFELHGLSLNLTALKLPFQSCGTH